MNKTLRSFAKRNSFLRGTDLGTSITLPPSVPEQGGLGEMFSIPSICYFQEVNFIGIALWSKVKAKDSKWFDSNDAYNFVVNGCKVTS